MLSLGELTSLNIASPCALPLRNHVIVKASSNKLRIDGILLQADDMDSDKICDRLCTK